MTSPTLNRYRVTFTTRDRFAGTFEAGSEENAIERAKFEIASTGTMGFAHTAGEFRDYDAQLIEEGVQP